MKIFQHRYYPVDEIRRIIHNDYTDTIYRCRILIAQEYKGCVPMKGLVITEAIADGTMADCQLIPEQYKEWRKPTPRVAKPKPPQEPKVPKVRVPAEQRKQVRTPDAVIWKIHAELDMLAEQGIYISKDKFLSDMVLKAKALTPELMFFVKQWEPPYTHQSMSASAFENLNRLQKIAQLQTPGYKVSLGAMLAAIFLEHSSDRRNTKLASKKN
jgi:hypothetical protein